MTDQKPPKMHAVTFECGPGCRYRFKAVPDTIEDSPDTPWHPWAYFHTCPKCGDQAAQASYEKGLMRATGPGTPEAIARSRRGLRGRRSEETARTRFNAIKTGAYAKTALYFPPRPGRYAECDECEHLVTLQCTTDGACLRRAELFVRHLAAFESGDQSLLTEMRAAQHAALQAMFDSMVGAVVRQGVTVAEPETAWNPEDKRHELLQYEDPATGEVQQVFRLKAHPLIKHLHAHIDKIGGNLTEMAMTPRSAAEQDVIEGHLDGGDGERETLREFAAAQQTQIEALRAQIERSRENLAKDPVLIEHKGAADD